MKWPVLALALILLIAVAQSNIQAGTVEPKFKAALKPKPVLKSRPNIIIYARYVGDGYFDIEIIRDYEGGYVPVPTVKFSSNCELDDIKPAMPFYDLASFKNCKKLVIRYTVQGYAILTIYTSITLPLLPKECDIFLRVEDIYGNTLPDAHFVCNSRTIYVNVGRWWKENILRGKYVDVVYSGHHIKEALLVLNLAERMIERYPHLFKVKERPMIVISEAENYDILAVRSEIYIPFRYISNSSLFLKILGHELFHLKEYEWLKAGEIRPSQRYIYEGMSEVVGYHVSGRGYEDVCGLSGKSLEELLEDVKKWDTFCDYDASYLIFERLGGIKFVEKALSEDMSLDEIQRLIESKGQG